VQTEGTSSLHSVSCFNLTPLPAEGEWSFGDVSSRNYRSASSVPNCQLGGKLLCTNILGRAFYNVSTSLGLAAYSVAGSSSVG
jgi:hypothetical protein